MPAASTLCNQRTLVSHAPLGNEPAPARGLEPGPKRRGGAACTGPAALHHQVTQGRGGLWRTGLTAGVGGPCSSFSRRPVSAGSNAMPPVPGKQGGQGSLRHGRARSVSPGSHYQFSSSSSVAESQHSAYLGRARAGSRGSVQRPLFPTAATPGPVWSPTCVVPDGQQRDLPGQGRALLRGQLQQPVGGDGRGRRDVVEPRLYRTALSGKGWEEVSRAQQGQPSAAGLDVNSGAHYVSLFPVA